MVLVSDKPSNDIGILQTKLRHREGHETRRVGLETMPLDQHIEGGHGARQARLNIRPASMHPLRVAGKFVRKYTLRHYSFCFKEMEAKFAEFSTTS